MKPERMNTVDRRLEVALADRDHWRKRHDRLVEVLTSIHGVMKPEAIELPDGRRYEFNNPAIEGEMFTALCDRIRAIPAEIAARRIAVADDLVQRLRNAATDWDGSQMLDGAPPRDILNCKDVRAIADEIERLRAEVAEAKRRASSAEFELNCLEQVRLRDNQYLIDRAEKAERELAALRERIEKAPIRPVLNDGEFDYIGCSTLGLFGKRVRLLVEE